MSRLRGPLCCEIMSLRPVIDSGTHQESKLLGLCPTGTSRDPGAQRRLRETRSGIWDTPGLEELTGTREILRNASPRMERAHMVRETTLPPPHEISVYPLRFLYLPCKNHYFSTKKQFFQRIFDFLSWNLDPSPNCVVLLSLPSSVP